MRCSTKYSQFRSTYEFAGTVSSINLSKNIKIFLFIYIYIFFERYYQTFPLENGLILIDNQMGLIQNLNILFTKPKGNQNKFIFTF